MKKIFQFSPVLLVVLLLFSWQPVVAQVCSTTSPTAPVGLVPEPLNGNPEFPKDVPCGEETFKLEEAGELQPGTYFIPYGSDLQAITIVVINGTCGPEFSWSTTGYVIHKIIVKGGPNANLYDYTMKSGYPFFADGKLHAQYNPRSRKYYGLSHISFCFEELPRLDVEKTADTKYTREFDWEIEKGPDGEYHRFLNDGQYHEYTIGLTKSLKAEYGFTVFGEITITNNTLFDATITGITDHIDIGGTIIQVTPVCPFTLPQTLAPAGSLTCTYEIELDGLCASINKETAGVNEVVVTTTGKVLGYSATADFDFADTHPDNITLVYDEVNVTDPMADASPWTFSQSGSVSYVRKFICSELSGEEPFEYPNTAEIVELGKTSSALVELYCYALQVEKDAHTSFDRTYEWDVFKTNDQIECDELIDFEDTFSVLYTVTAKVTGYFDDNWAVEGEITVTNPAPIAGKINSLSDIITPGDIVPTLDCGVTFPIWLAPSGTLTCSYSALLPNADTRLNTATVVLQNYDYHFEDPPLATGTTSFSGTADIDFDEAVITEYDECADVYDQFGNDPEEWLGEVCFDGVLTTIPKDFVFEYSREVGFADLVDVPEPVCGWNYEVENYVKLITVDLLEEATAESDVCFFTPCTPPGCESAWAKGNSSTCFINDGFGNWGWTNLVQPGDVQTWPLYAGAAHCDPANGTHVGSVIVSYSGGSLTVTYNLLAGFTMTDVHIYVGTAKYPLLPTGMPTIAPGQYTYGTTLENGTTFSRSFNVSGNVYVIAHAVVCGSYDKSIQVVEDAKVSLTVAPNPFRDMANIRVISNANTRATVEVYNMTGLRVATLYEGPMNAHEIYNFRFSSADSNQFYMVVVRTPDGVTSSKMLKVR